MKILFVLWSCVLLFVSFRGLDFRIAFFSFDNLLGNYNFIPFSFVYYLVGRLSYFEFLSFSLLLKECIRGIYDFIFNIILFVPFGILMKNTYKKTVLYAVILSFSIEALQLLAGLFNISDRVCDINDIIASFIGASLGYYINKKIKTKKPTHL